jgi:hypothetical protein
MEHKEMDTFFWWSLLGCKWDNMKLDLMETSFGHMDLIRLA